MDQPWWVFGLIALVCAILVIVVKVLEKKVLNDDMDLDLLSMGLGIISFLTAIMMMGKLGFA